MTILRNISIRRLTSFEIPFFFAEYRLINIKLLRHKWNSFKVLSRRGGEIFPYPSVPALGHTMGTGYITGIKWPGRGVDHTPPHLALRLKKEYRYESTPPSGPSWPILGTPLPLPLTFTFPTALKIPFFFVQRTTKKEGKRSKLFFMYADEAISYSWPVHIQSPYKRYFLSYFSSVPPDEFRHMTAPTVHFTSRQFDATSMSSATEHVVKYNNSTYT